LHTISPLSPSEPEQLLLIRLTLFAALSSVRIDRFPNVDEIRDGMDLPLSGVITRRFEIDMVSAQISVHDLAGIAYDVQTGRVRKRGREEEERCEKRREERRTEQNRTEEKRTRREEKEKRTRNAKNLSFSWRSLPFVAPVVPINSPYSAPTIAFER
jgi:hypothetical protein